MWSENGIGDYVEPMTADEFESFGKKMGMERQTQ